MEVFLVIVACLIGMFFERPKATIRTIKRVNNKVNELSTRIKVNRTLDEGREMTPEQFFRIREYTNGFSGVYVIYNQTRDLFYVGQAQNVYQRVNNHFTGKGNGDVYADYKYGDQFVLWFVPLASSGFNSLDALEKFYINKYDAVRRGYNKRKGNG